MPHKAPSRAVSLVYLSALCLTVSACLGLGEEAPPNGMSQQQLTQVQMAASALPRLQPGDRFTYDSDNITDMSIGIKYRF